MIVSRIPVQSKRGQRQLPGGDGDGGARGCDWRGGGGSGRWDACPTFTGLRATSFIFQV